MGKMTTKEAWRNLNESVVSSDEELSHWMEVANKLVDEENEQSEV